jgi:hypothetical protein
MIFARLLLDHVPALPTYHGLDKNSNKLSDSIIARARNLYCLIVFTLEMWGRTCPSRRQHVLFCRLNFLLGRPTTRLLRRRTAVWLGSK